MDHAITKFQMTEGFLHLLFWVFIFSAVNVSWHQDWFDPTIRANTPAPLSVLIFPFFFYAHAYWAIPRYLANRKWLGYFLSLMLVFVCPELIRLFFYAAVFNLPPETEIFSRDSFLLGNISIGWIAFNFSLVYRLLVDSVFTGRVKKPATLKAEPGVQPSPVLSLKESQMLMDALAREMNERQPFLDNDLKLSNLSDRLGITEKKLSTLLNHFMNTTFSDYVNGYRVGHFLQEVRNGKLNHLTVSGLMKECGFSSKATFYRAFKKMKDCTPTEWLKRKQ